MAIEFEETLLPEDTVAIILRDVYQLAGVLRRWGDRVAARSGQTQVRWQVLRAASAGTRTVPQIARRLGLTRQSVQRVAQQLIEEGYARYIWNKDQPRSPILRPTMRSRDRLDNMAAAASAFHKDLAGGLHPDDLQAAAIVLQKFCAQIEREPLPDNPWTSLARRP